jgi:hypothetical protein
MDCMSYEHDDRRPERPRAEPEILPPDRAVPRERSGSEEYVWFDPRGGTHRIYVARPGPFSIIAALLITGLVVAAIVLLLLGLVLFWIPVVIVIIASFLLAGYTRHYWRRLKNWMAGRHESPPPRRGYP